MEVDGEPAMPLVDIRAGLMLAGTDGTVAADSRKGMLRIACSEDTLTHVQWYLRVGAEATGAPEHDIVVFPGECTLQQIPGQPRCYMLHFNDDPSRDMFFWMQNVKPEDDTALVAAFNAALEGQDVSLPPPATIQPQQQQQPAAAMAAAPQQQQQARPAQPDLASILSSALSAAAAGGMPASQPDPTQLAASLLQQLGAQYGQRRVPVDEGPGLHEVLKPDMIIPILQRHPEMMNSLAQHLPEQHRDLSHLIATLRSPQFMQQVATFSVAMQTGQLDLAQFGLQSKGFSAADFLEAVQELANKENKEAAGTGPSRTD